MTVTAVCLQIQRYAVWVPIQNVLIPRCDVILRCGGVVGHGSRDHLTSPVRKKTNIVGASCVCDGSRLTRTSNCAVSSGPEICSTGSGTSVRMCVRVGAGTPGWEAGFALRSPGRRPPLVLPAAVPGETGTLQRVMDGTAPHTGRAWCCVMYVL